MADLSNFRPGLSCFYKTDSGGGTAVQEYHITATGLGITKTYELTESGIDVQGGQNLGVKGLKKVLYSS